MVLRRRLILNKNCMNEVELAKRLKKIQELTEECLGFLSGIIPKDKIVKARKSISSPVETDVDSIDFSIPLRPFIKKYSEGMSGQKKFTLILASLSKGKSEEQVTLVSIEKSWNSMTAILGSKFNRFYSQTAKDNDWVTSLGKGTYSLRPNWKKIFD